MSVVQIGLLLLASFFLMLALSVPVSISLIVSSLVTVSAALPLDLSTFVACQKMVSGVDSFSLLAVPFFILTGVLMNTGGIAQRLINLAKAFVGRIPGGLAHTNIVGNTMFGALSGSAVAASIAVGGVMLPEEEAAGYDKKFAAAANIASAPTGLIIPPSGILCCRHDHVRLCSGHPVVPRLHGSRIHRCKEEQVPDHRARAGFRAVQVLR